MAHRLRLKHTALVAGEILAVVAAATALVALLENIASATSLGVVFVLAVMFVAVRRGEVAAVATASAPVLSLNFFLIPPRHRLTIADDHTVVPLAAPVSAEL